MKGLVGLMCLTLIFVIVLMVCNGTEESDDYYYYEGYDNNDNGIEDDYRYDYFDEDVWDHQNHTPLPYYRGCGMKSDENNTILINPKYPQPYVGGSRCSYRIYSESHRICQLRIDFLSFSLAPPTGDGLCSTDYLSIEGGSTAVPRICGENTGQHVYVGVVGRLPVWINVATSSGQAFTRRWQFRVTQIRCASPNRAPTGCLQYYLEPSGTIRSFNYAMEESAATNSIGVQGSRQIASLDYNICIKTQAGKCSITYKRPVSDPYAFTLTDDVKSVDIGLLGTSVLQSLTCTTDFISIPSPSQIIRGVRVPLGNNLFCGLGIGDIYSRAQPFTVRSVTDANETPDIANRGFYLTYSQDICI